MNTINPTSTEAVSTEAQPETAITPAASAASATLPLTPEHAVVPAQFSPPVRATTGEPWPGKGEWNDHDYRQFVDLVSQGAFPEIDDDSCAWDDFFVRDLDSETPFRPTLISPGDYRDHLTFHRDYYGILAWKLWDVARSKGFTAAYEEQMQRERDELDYQEALELQQQVRRELDELKQSMPAPQPLKPKGPRQRWQEFVLQTLPPQAPLVDKVKYVQAQVMEGQPFRNALLHNPSPEVLDSTFGPLMLDESSDALADPLEIEEPEPVHRKWAPDATTEEIIYGSARDLSDLIALLIARQRLAVGFGADSISVKQTIRLTRSLRDLTAMLHTAELTSQVKRRGRPRKNRLPK